MGTIAEKLTYLEDTKTAIKDAISAKGVQVADDTPFRNYADKIGEISGGGEPVEKTKFGASVDTWLGDVDENGVLKKTTWTGALNFAGVKTVYSGALYYAFAYCAGITSVDLSSLESIDNNGLEYAFYYCVGITSVDLSSLQSVSNYGMNYAFAYCAGITSVDLSSLQSVSDYGMYRSFAYCAGITSVDLSSLENIGSSGLQSAFDSCKNLTKISFPSLTSVQSNSFGSATSTSAFRNCTALTEIHFRADMQATIEAMSQYGTKFGATNATIYFDL